MKCINKYKILNALSFLTLSAAFLLLLVVFYWVLYPYKPLVITKQPVSVVIKEVEQGNFLHLKVNYCKYMPISAEVTRSFINDIIYSTSAVLTSNEMGCRETVTNVFVPRELPGGHYYLRTTYRYEVNPIRHIDVVSISEPFVVIEKAENE